MAVDAIFKRKFSSASMSKVSGLATRPSTFTVHGRVGHRLHFSRIALLLMLNS